MSAICAIYRFDGAPVTRAAIDGLLDGLRDFGPESASWAPETSEAPVALGCRPFRVTPQDAGYRPPVRSPDGRVMLVADARIDNRAELAAELGLPPADARELPDAGFILAAYQAWGAGLARRLLGDFAFVLWDARTRSLFAARDGLGQRVLFLHTTPDRLALASRPQALLALDGVRARFNQQKAAEFLVLLQDASTTFFEGIGRLRPGHTLTATPDGIRTERFWSPEPTRRIVFGSDREYVEGFLEVFDRAVEAQTRSAGPVGMMLSGGLDSGAVAVTAAARLAERNHPLLAWHAAPRPGFTQAGSAAWVADESDDVAAIAARYPNLDLTIQRPDGRLPLEAAGAIFRWTGLPVRNPNNWSWVEAVYGAAKEAGSRVLLTGNKGNLTISYTGLRSLRDLAREGRWARVWREAGGVARVTNQRTWSVVWDQVVQPLMPAFLEEGYRRVRGERTDPIWSRTYSAIRPDVARASGLEEQARALGLGERNVRRCGGVPFRLLTLNGAGDVADVENGLRAWFGVETRDPTADLRVVEYCLAIPGSQYLHDGRNRWLIRRAMEGRLPERVRERRTRGAQGADWIEWFPAMRDGFRTALDRMERSDIARRLLDIERMRGLIDRWPERLGRDHETDYKLLLLRGIMMGRFICWFEDTFG